MRGTKHTDSSDTKAPAAQNVAVYVPAAALIEALKRELGEAQILLLLSQRRPAATPECQILVDAGNKLRELEEARRVEEARIEKIGDFDAIPKT
jgi:hypothetical protein